MSIEVIVNRQTLDRITARDKHASFLMQWLSDHKTKAVIIPRHWKQFMRKWESALKEVDEDIKNPFFAFMRGIVTPYRDKYTEEAGIEIEDDEDIRAMNDTDAAVTIANRHYATCRYLIVDDPKEYHGKKLKIGDDKIVTLEGFCKEVAITDNRYKNFFKDYEISMT